MLVGFSFDFVLAKRPDSLVNNTLLLTYLLVAAAFIVFLNLREARTKKSAEPLFMLLILQFCFGGLASNMLILYGHSGTVAGSALFLGMLVALIFGNEFLRSRYTRLRFNVGVYYFLLLTYCVVAVPTFVVHALGTWVFVLSGIVSVAVIAVFLFVLWSLVLRRYGSRGIFDTTIIVATVFCVFNGLYFLDIIPPVPLSLKNIGIYHSVLKQNDGGYAASYEPAPWWKFWQDTSTTYTLSLGESAFCFSSVFAPTDLSTAIYHRWEEYDPAAGVWVTMSRVSFAISGGRDQGFRGWSMKSGLMLGKWRCNVETSSGALIGRITFDIVAGSTTPALSQSVL